MEREELIAYAMNFSAFIMQENIGKHISRIILFGSVARNDFDKESDIDIFIDSSKDIEKEIERILALFLKSEIQKKWELRGLKHKISLKIGNLDEWGLKRSIISDGVLLYGKFKEFPDKAEQYYLLELGFNKFKRNKKVSLWRRLYGYKQRVNKRDYETKGIIEEINGKRINGSVLLPVEKAKSLLDYLHKEKIKYMIREIWSDKM